MSNPLTISQQISDQYGAPPPRKKRQRTQNDLFDILDGGTSTTAMEDANNDEGMYDASLPDSIPGFPSYGGPEAIGLGQSMDFSTNGFMGSDAMDTDPLRQSGTMLGASGGFSAPTANLFTAQVKFDPGITMTMQHQFFGQLPVPTGSSAFDSQDPAAQALQLLQNSVVNAMQMDASSMDSSPFSPSSGGAPGGQSQHHQQILGVVQSEGVIPADRNLLLEPKRMVAEIRVCYAGVSCACVSLVAHFGTWCSKTWSN